MTETEFREMTVSEFRKWIRRPVTHRWTRGRIIYRWMPGRKFRFFASVNRLGEPLHIAQRIREVCWLVPSYGWVEYVHTVCGPVFADFAEVETEQKLLCRACLKGMERRILRANAARLKPAS